MMKPYGVLVNHAPERLATVASHPKLTKTKITFVRSQPMHTRQLKKHMLQSENSLFCKPPPTAIYCHAYPSNVVSNTLNKTAELCENQCYSLTDMTADFGYKIKEIAESITFHVHQWYQSNLELQEVVLPICGTLLATSLAWYAIPVTFFEFYTHICWNPALTYLGVTTKIEVPYENSVWKAFEVPVKYLVVFMAFAHVAPIVAPGISEYLPQLWEGAILLSLVWFLRRWKDNSLSIVLANEAILGLNKDKLSFLDKLSSLGLNLIAILGLSEIFDVGATSILTFSGVGGIAAAYGSQDITANVLSGLILQLQKPFSVGDCIKAGSIEGEITEIGLISTSLIDPEELPVVVPNRVFSSEMIVNKS